MNRQAHSSPYDAKAVANFFLAKQSGITQMQLQKILYYAHGWHLGFRGEPLLDEMVEAWRYGPVVPSIYHEFKDLGARKITRLATDFNFRTYDFDVVPEVSPRDQFVNRVLVRVWEVYRKYSAAELSRMTHAINSPWSITRRKYPDIKGVDIPNELIEEHFRSRILDRQKREQHQHDK